jgi:hypothetical protein
MLQMLYLDITYVTVAMHIRCKRMFQMFHLFQTYVAECFILQMFSLADSIRSSRRRMQSRAAKKQQATRSSKRLRVRAAQQRRAAAACVEVQ